MKKIVLGCAMLFAVTCAQANDVVVVGNAVVDEVVYASEEIVVSSAVEDVNVMPECWSVSCGTMCDMADDASDYWGSQDIEDVFDLMESLC